MNPNGFPCHLRQAGMLQSTWPALAKGHQTSPGWRNIVSHMPREGCLEMGLKTPSFLCRGHPTVKTIRLEKNIPDYLAPKLSLEWSLSSVCGYWDGMKLALLPLAMWQKPLAEQKYKPLNSTKFGGKHTSGWNGLPSSWLFFLYPRSWERLNSPPKSSTDGDSRPDSPTWIKDPTERSGKIASSIGGDVTGQKRRGTPCTEHRWQQVSVGQDRALRHTNPAQR